MRESAAMLEIRKIRDENSLRHLKMTSEEISKELDESMKWFISAMGKNVKVISSPRELRN
jgi:cysteine synthase